MMRKLKIGVVAALVLAQPVAAMAQSPRRADVPAAQLCSTAAAAIDAAAARTMARGSPGMVVAVAHSGRTLFQRGYGLADVEHRAPMQADTVFRVASVTKQFTAAAVLLLAQEGRVDLQAPVSRYLPDFPRGNEVTVYQLLVHTSGIPDYSEDPAGDANKAAARPLADMVAWIARLEPGRLFPPGTRWAYSNSNYVLLGQIVERVGGQPLAAFFEQRLFRPAGLTHTAFDDPGDIVPHRARGYRRAAAAPSGFRNADWISHTVPGPAGGLRTTAADLLRWSNALFEGRILPRESLRRMISPGVMSDGRTTKFGMPEAWQVGLNSDYAMGFFTTSVGGVSRVSHGGDIDGFQSWLAHYPEQGVTIALLQNSQSADFDKDAIERAVLQSVSGSCPAG